MSNRLLQTLNGQSGDVPIWFMRQAGRYLPEYRELRSTAKNFLDFCYTPSMAVEATLQPMRRFDLDAAIIFSDILVIPQALGQYVTFVQGEGPKLSRLDHPAELYQLSRRRFADTLAPVYTAIGQVRQQLPVDKALFGFAGAPWTLACYMLQGGGNKTFPHAMRWVTEHQDGLDNLINILVDAVTEHLLAQVAAGATVLQLFDSWAGLLAGDAAAFSRFVIAPTARILQHLKDQAPNIPVIAFPRQAGQQLLSFIEGTDARAVSLDDHVDLTWAAAHVPAHVVLQGNLSPQTLVAGGDALEKACIQAVNIMRHRPYIFNLGHGVVPETPPAHVAAAIAAVRKASST